MPPAPLLSIVVPAFNAEATVAHTLDSIRTQTFGDFEVLVVDDGSTDSTASVVRNFCAGDSRFILIQQPNAGVSAARNAGIERARGELIAFLDADDEWLPEKLAKQVALLRDNPRINFSYTNFYIWDGTKVLKAYYSAAQMPDGDVSRRIFRSTLFLPSTVVLRRELLGDCRFDPRFAGGEDWDLWMQLVERGLFAGGLAEPLARYRRWEGNATANKLKMTESGCRVLDKNLAATRRPELKPLYRRALNLMRARLEILESLNDPNASPAETARALRRAWKRYPRRVRWLWAGLLLRLPLGNGFRQAVRQKIVDKYS
ncbi:MAG TPA: glycosyltransferase family 2 protein [Verrucomicrobiae bacterium]|nr:glycosyltransferase family 2 protein [Verrucomicrobiae bacterium]